MDGSGPRPLEDRAGPLTISDLPAVQPSTGSPLPGPGRADVVYSPLPDPVRSRFEGTPAQPDSRRIRTRRERHRSRLVRRLLPSLVASYADVPPDRLRFTRECRHCGDADHGKPRVVGPEAASGIGFNLADTGDLVAVGVADGISVGIDVEGLGRDPGVADVEEIALTPDEREMLRGTDEGDRDAVFYQLWTRKEAYLKMTGKGLAVPPRAVEVLGDPEPGAPLRVEADGLDPGWVVDLRTGAGWVGALAAAEPLDGIGYRKLDLATIGASAPEDDPA